jgi:hypothetical protein
MPTQDEIDGQKKLLAAWRQTLAELLQQQAMHGSADTPLHVRNDIRQARTHISRVKAVLQDWQVSVENHPDDAEPAAIPLLVAPQQQPNLQSALSQWLIVLIMIALILALIIQDARSDLTRPDPRGNAAPTTATSLVAGSSTEHPTQPTQGAQPTAALTAVSPMPTGLPAQPAQGAQPIAATAEPALPSPEPPASPAPAPEPSFPCEAQIAASGGTAALARLSAFHGAPGQESISTGTTVTVVQKSANNNGSSEAWYLVANGDGRQLGWVNRSDLQLSPACPT